ncbi:hypothetical protein P7K49_002447 [Saguinus oedipus]|uniref:Uncharacterized protein n=1 Tax=Saguinus oedipus TaxID=9490 RepID=A0ABQ9WHE4_SAGOE|nr:hypothetical protein P7K49_002447 [Saguinus oedipus]
MLLSLLGPCAVVGPFHGPEWEPVQGLLSQDHSCRDPQCCSNLLVLCLLLVWQVWHYWHQVTRTHFSTRNVIKVPLQKQAVPSMSTQVRAHLQVFTPTLSPFFCTTSVSSTCLMPEDSSWKARQVPWCLRDGQTHPALDMCHEMEQLLLHSEERLVSLEPVISMRSRPTSKTLTTSLPNLLSAQRLQFCSRELLPDHSHQTLRMCTWKSWDCPSEAWEPGGKNKQQAERIVERPRLQGG